MRVCIDARSLTAGAINGTGVYAVELIRRLSAPIEVSALADNAELPGALRRLAVRRVDTPAGCDVFHRPSQIFDPAHLELLLHTPVPVVLTYLDLIAYRTPALFASAEDHERFCAVSFASLQAAHAVLAISEN